MALSKRKSRKITVDGVAFRYVISTSSKGEAVFNLNITVQNEVSNGGRLLVKGLVTRSFWLDFPDRVHEIDSGTDSNPYLKITPADIAYLIHLAIEKGWQHQMKKQDFIFELNQSDKIR